MHTTRPERTMILKNNSIFMEFFSDLRNHKRARLYMTILMLRRILYVVIVLVIKDSPRAFIYFCLITMQLVYLVGLVWVFPYEENQNNIIEIINEGFLLLTVVYLSSMTNEESWSGSSEGIFLLILAINVWLVTMVILFYLLLDLFEKIKAKCTKKKDDDSSSTISAKLRVELFKLRDFVFYDIFRLFNKIFK